jgi:hypothetical protein
MMQNCPRALLIAIALASHSASAGFPVDLSINDVINAPVDYAFPTQPGQAVAILGVGAQSQVHVFDGSNVTETYRDQFQRVPNVRVDGSYSDQTRQRADDIFFAVKSSLLLFSSIANSFNVFDITATGEVRYRQNFIDRSASWSFIREGTNYFRANHWNQYLRNSLTNSYIPYNACASLAPTSAGCNSIGTVEANSSGFWILRSRSAALPGMLDVEMARFSVTGALLEVQPLLHLNAPSLWAIQFTRDISGAIHIALLPSDAAPITALRIEDRSGFSITHSGRFDCRLCRPQMLKHAGLGEWIVVAMDDDQQQIRKFALAPHVAGLTPAAASLRFAVDIPNLSSLFGIEIETSLGGQCIVRYRAQSMIVNEVLRLSASGAVLPSENWLTADFGIGELLFVTKRISLSGETRIAGSWINQQGLAVLPDELIGTSLVNPQYATPFFATNGQLYVVVRYPQTVHRATEIWRVDADGNAVVVLSYPSTSQMVVANGHALRNAQAGSLVYFLNQDSEGRYRVRQFDVENGRETVSDLLEIGGCKSSYAAAIDTTFLVMFACEENWLTYSVVAGRFRLLDNALTRGTGFQALDPSAGSTDLAHVSRWSETLQQLVVYGVSADAYTPRYVIPGEKNLAPILTADGGALVPTDQPFFYTKYRASLPPIIDHPFCGYEWRQDGAGNFWSLRHRNDGTSEVCYTDTQGSLRSRALLRELLFYQTTVADNGDLLQLRPDIQRFTPTSNDSIAVSAPQMPSEDWLGDLSTAVRFQSLAVVAQKEVSVNPLVSRLRTVLHLRTIPPPSLVDEYLHRDNFEEAP